MDKRWAIHRGLGVFNCSVHVNLLCYKGRRKMSASVVFEVSFFVFGGLVGEFPHLVSFQLIALKLDEINTKGFYSIETKVKM
jgi:hypothetical protein